MTFRFERTAIPDVVLIEPEVHLDGRGFFMEVYRHSSFANAGLSARFIQDNCSRSIKAVLRGLHYQRDPMAQAKLVRAVNGEVFDVAVDIRKGSPSYGRWVGTILSAENRRMLYVPEGFAHGFCTLSETAEVHYKVTREYSPEHDAGLLWNDPEIAIDWPISTPVLSEKDASYPRLSETDPGFEFRGSP